MTGPKYSQLKISLKRGPVRTWSSRKSDAFIIPSPGSVDAIACFFVGSHVDLSYNPTRTSLTPIEGGICGESVMSCSPQDCLFKLTKEQQQLLDQAGSSAPTTWCSRGSDWPANSYARTAAPSQPQATVSAVINRFIHSFKNEARQRSDLFEPRPLLPLLLIAISNFL